MYTCGGYDCRRPRYEKNFPWGLIEYSDSDTGTAFSGLSALSCLLSPPGFPPVHDWGTSPLLLLVECSAHAKEEGNKLGSLFICQHISTQKWPIWGQNKKCFCRCAPTRNQKLCPFHSTWFYYQLVTNWFFISSSASGWDGSQTARLLSIHFAVKNISPLAAFAHFLPLLAEVFDTKLCKEMKWSSQLRLLMESCVVWTLPLPRSHVVWTPH